MTAFRTGYLAGACPFSLKGIGGPGAPHYFKLQRRANAGSLAESDAQFLEISGQRFAPGRADQAAMGVS